jgi:uncharacterized protein (TIGR03437 family)
MKWVWVSVLMVCIGSELGRASEADALAISANIQAKHTPFATLLDPIYQSADSDQIAGYTRCGDSALWTGAYLAAETFRYKVTGAVDALANLKGALAGLEALSNVTGDNRLARCIMPASSPYAAGIASEEAQNGINSNPPWLWVDNTSRDQMVGALFGLGVAYDLVDDAAVKSRVSGVVTRLVGFVSRHQWSPNDNVAGSFVLRPEELEMLIGLARHVNPSNTVSGPFFVPPIDLAVTVDVQSNSSYFKFNLDYMSFYHLIRLQDIADNRDAYMIVRKYTATHGNAFFNMIDRALRGPDAARDAETRTLLDQWLQRSRRDYYVDLSRTVTVCGSEACKPVPVPLRPAATFLWQDDPFQLAGGGSGRVESSGLDYILPYWMARYYGVVGGDAVLSAAAPSNGIAPASLASLYGQNLTTITDTAGSLPLPTILQGTTLTVTDSAGRQFNAPLLYASPSQINFEVPEAAAAGPATFVVQGGAAAQNFSGTIQKVAPALFSMNGTGSGVAAAYAIAVQAADPQVQLPVPVFQCAAAGCTSLPITVAVGRSVYVSFYGTGIRNGSSLANVTVTIGGLNVPVLYAGPAPGFQGLDQVNVSLLLGLLARGESDVVLTVDGKTANTVTINIH